MKIKRVIKVFLAMVLLALSVAMFVACDDAQTPPTPQTPPTKLEIDARISEDVVQTYTFELDAYEIKRFDFKG